MRMCASIYKQLRSWSWCACTPSPVHSQIPVILWKLQWNVSDCDNIYKRQLLHSILLPHFLFCTLKLSDIDCVIAGNPTTLIIITELPQLLYYFKHTHTHHALITLHVEYLPCVHFFKELWIEVLRSCRIKPWKTAIMTLLENHMLLAVQWLLSTPQILPAICF